MPHRHCKTCRSPLHADETQAECVSCLGKSHADAALSGTDCFHCESFSLASLRTWIAFFSESDSASRALPFSSCQGPVKKKQRWQRIRAAGYKQLTSAQCPRASPSPQREHSPILFSQYDQHPSAAVSNMILSSQNHGAPHTHLASVLLLTSVDGAEEKGYKHLPPPDESVAAHLFPSTGVG